MTAPSPTGAWRVEHASAVSIPIAGVALYRGEALIAAVALAAGYLALYVVAARRRGDMG